MYIIFTYFISHRWYFCFFVFVFWIGGFPGHRGLNLLIRKDGRMINLGAKASVDVKPGVSYAETWVFKSFWKFENFFKNLTDSVFLFIYLTVGSNVLSCFCCFVFIIWLLSTIECVIWFSGLDLDSTWILCVCDFLCHWLILLCIMRWRYRSLGFD